MFYDDSAYILSACVRCQKQNFCVTCYEHFLAVYAQLRFFSNANILFIVMVIIKNQVVLKLSAYLRLALYQPVTWLINNTD